MFKVIFLILCPCVIYGQIDTLYNQLEKKGHNTESIDWLNKAIGKVVAQDPAKAEELAVKSLALSRALDYKEGIAKSYFNIGLSFWHRDLHDRAMENYLEALTLFEQLEQPENIARVKMNIGISYDELGQVNKAKSYIKGALGVYEALTDSAKMMNGYLNLGVIYFYEQSYDSALSKFQAVLKYRASKEDSSATAILHLNIANVYEYQEKMVEAIESYGLARRMVAPDQLLAINIDLGLGNALLMEDNAEEGLPLIHEALRKAKAKEQFKMEQYAYEALKDYFKSQRDYENAFKYQALEIELERTHRGKEVQEQIEVLQLKYEDEKKAKQLALLASEQAQNKLYLIIATIGGVTLLLGAVLMFIIFKLRMKNVRLKAQDLEQKLEHKNKELAAYALNFIQKNELLNELTEKVNTVKQGSSEKTSRELNQINQVIKSHMRIDQDWENFKLMFEEVHEGFFFRLKENYPDLGNAELKLSALLRLNMNLKESSQVLGISSDSVKTARSRLRKKLGLSKEENLVDFMIMFDARTKHKLSA